MKQLNVGAGGNIIYKKNYNRENFNRYVSDISKYTPLTVDEEIELFNLIKIGDKNAVDKIYKHNLLFVISVAKQYQFISDKSNITLDDLISEGNIGLYESIHTFDITRGFKFISYAVWKIRSNILLYINNNVRIYKLPSNVTTALLKVEKELSYFEQQYNMTITADDIHDCDIKDLWNKIKYYQGFDISYDKQISNDNENTLLDILNIPDTDTDNKESVIITQELLNYLPKHIQNIIIDRYGLFNNTALSIDDLSIKYDKSKSIIDAILKKYLKHLKNNFKYEENGIISKNLQSPIIKFDKNIKNRPSHEYRNGVLYTIEYCI